MKKMSSDTRQTEAEIALFWERGPVLSLDIEVRSKIPGTIEKWLKRADAASPHRKIAVVQLHNNGCEHSEDICILRAADLRELLGGVR